MSMRVPKTSNNCEYCEKILHGRADQRFCNDTCRNSFNRKVRAAERIVFHPNAGEIIKIIKKNYETLSRGIPGEIEETKQDSLEFRTPTKWLQSKIFHQCFY